MGKNRVAPDNNPNKNRGNFFIKPRNKFKSNSKQQNTNKPKKFHQFSKENEKSVNLKPSVSGSDEFFVKPYESGKALEASASKPQETSNTSKEKHDQNLIQGKKTFDKKTWRLQKYSKKYKLQQWEDKRRQAALRGYYKNLKEDGPKLDVKKIYEEYKDDEPDSEDSETNINQNAEERSNLVVGSSVTSASMEKEDAAFAKVPQNSRNRKNKAFKKAHLEFQRIKEEKQKVKEEALNKKAEREEALKEYKKKKTEKFKRLSKRTKKGQPIMKDRIEMMLESIQKSLKND